MPDLAGQPSAQDPPCSLMAPPRPPRARPRARWIQAARPAGSFRGLGRPRAAAGRQRSCLGSSRPRRRSRGSALASALATRRPTRPPASPGSRQRLAEPLSAKSPGSPGPVSTAAGPAPLTSPARARRLEARPWQPGARRRRRRCRTGLAPRPQPPGFTQGAPSPALPRRKAALRTALGRRGLSLAHPSASGPAAAVTRGLRPLSAGCVGALQLLLKVRELGSHLLTPLSSAYLQGDDERVVVGIISARVLPMYPLPGIMLSA